MAINTQQCMFSSLPFICSTGTTTPERKNLCPSSEEEDGSVESIQPTTASLHIVPVLLIISPMIPDNTIFQSSTWLTFWRER